jgi:hypothetical protein
MDRTFRVPCTRERKPRTCYFLGGRTWEQFVAVGEIVAREDFDYAEGDPKEDFAPDKNGPMTFKYYTTDGVLHTVRIGVSGREFRHHTRKRSPAAPVGAAT